MRDVRVTVRNNSTRLRREGDRKLEQIRTAGEDTWAHLKAESEHAWNAMKDALEAFKAHYRKDGDSSKGSADHAE